jgi:hypothetical protein
MRSQAVARTCPQVFWGALQQPASSPLGIRNSAAQGQVQAACCLLLANIGYPPLLVGAATKQYP